MEELFPEAIVVEIVARSPLRTIARFKSVSKKWKSIFESPYFRRRFLTLHKNSSSSWSLMFKTEFSNSPSRETLGFHGCDTWNLPKPPGSYTIPFQDYSYIATSNGLHWISAQHKFYVGNPVLQKWVQITRPSCPFPLPWVSLASGLVTRVDQDGVVSGFKIVYSCRIRPENTLCWRVNVYSSETGEWAFERLRCSSSVGYSSFYPPVSINGTLYLLERDYLVAHDFYASGSEADQCKVIPLPVGSCNGALTTSGGDLMFVDLQAQRLMLWKLDNGHSWKLCWDVNTVPLGYHADFLPLAVNPFDANIVYLWSLHKGCLVSGNLRANEFAFHRQSESECCLVITENCEKYMEELDSYSHHEDLHGPPVMLSQFVLPRWMDSIPHSPTDITT